MIPMLYIPSALYSQDIVISVLYISRTLCSQCFIFPVSCNLSSLLYFWIILISGLWIVYSQEHIFPGFFIPRMQYSHYPIITGTNISRTLLAQVAIFPRPYFLSSLLSKSAPFSAPIISRTTYSQHSLNSRSILYS